MRKNNRFIIIRGPSGAGKSTAAHELFNQSTERTVIIHQDYYRFIFKPAGAGSMPNSEVIHKMIEHNSMAALDGGYDVILEGILSVKSYENILNRIIAAHKGPSFMFYLDVSFEETAKRHQAREDKSSVTVDDMRIWYDGAHKSNHRLEQLIPESYTVGETVKSIQKGILVDELGVNP
ncbi:MAG: kinase [Proteobacteria bacterium]|nr:kinase [Pseudomonadota bacterium]